MSNGHQGPVSLIFNGVEEKLVFYPWLEDIPVSDYHNAN